MYRWPCQTAAVRTRLWGSARCPIAASARVWVDAQLAWLVDEFGRQVIERAVLVPTAENFPADAGAGEHALVQSVVESLCGQVGVESPSLDIEIFEDQDRVAQAALGVGGWTRTRAGDWRKEDGRSVIAVDRGIFDSPRRLVATIAHELCHERLIGEARIDADRPDGEELTDLATVFFGLGVFTANAASEFTGDADGRWQARRLGYLDQATLGYALARFSFLRGEVDPSWARYLDTNPAGFMRRSARYLARDTEDRGER